MTFPQTRIHRQNLRVHVRGEIDWHGSAVLDNVPLTQQNNSKSNNKLTKSMLIEGNATESVLHVNGQHVLGKRGWKISKSIVRPMPDDGLLNLQVMPLLFVSAIARPTQHTGLLNLRVMPLLFVSAIDTPTQHTGQSYKKKTQRRYASETGWHTSKRGRQYRKSLLHVE